MSEPKALTPIAEFRGTLAKMEPQFQMALPSHIKSEKFIRVVQTAVALDPSILEKDRNSLFAACTKAAQQGLLPDGEEGALVPFKGQVKFLPMVKGILKKVRNSGELSFIESEVVYKEDHFKWGTTQKGKWLNHEPAEDGEEKDEDITHAYAIACTKDGGTYVEVMSRKKLDKVRAVSRAENSPWKTWLSEMCRKTVIKRLSKRLPMSTDLEETLNLDNEIYDVGSQEGQSKPANKTSRRLNDIIDQEAVEQKDSKEVPI